MNTIDQRTTAWYGTSATTEALPMPLYSVSLRMQDTSGSPLANTSNVLLSSLIYFLREEDDAPQII